MNKLINEQPIDQKIRDEVINPESSYLVQAPAGSGKTTSLARRILEILTVVESPKEIIAISFTNKAAAEMHENVLRQYNEQEDYGTEEVVKKIEDRAKELNWGRDFMSQLEIMTIDSLASKITRQAPLLSESLFMNTSDDPYAVYEAAVKETMKDNNQLTELFPFLNYDYQKIKNQLIAQLETRDQWIEQIQYYKNNPTKIENETKLYYLNEMKTWVIKLNGLFKKEQIEDIKSILSYQDSKFLKEENNIDFWLMFRDLIMTKDGNIRKRFGPNEGFPKDKEGIFYSSKLLDLLINLHINNTLKDFNNVVYKENIADIFPTKMHNAAVLLSDLELKLQEQFTVRGELDYTQVIRNAIVTLTDNTDIAILFDEKVSHILIDEFQDINTLQQKFLMLLTDNFSGTPGKSFFAVGDPMQSIYRFRKAEVSIFDTLQKKQQFGDIRVKACKLEVNFRSNIKIINWLNDSYKNAFGQIDNTDIGLIRYHPSFSGPKTKDIEGDGVKFHILKNKIKDNYTEKKLEADYIFKIIQKIKAKKKETEIVILARNRSHLRSLLTLMRTDGSFSIEATEIDSIEYNQSFQDILCLTKALYNFNDKVSWIGILRAPWCGLKLEDLTCLFDTNSTETPWFIINNPSITERLTSDGQKRLNFLKRVINKSIQFRGRVAHRFFIESIWRQLLGKQTIVDTNDMERIDKFFDLVDKSSTPLSIDFEKLDRIIKDLNTNDGTNKPYPVKFFTMHKAKGDQFECVIIPGLGRVPKSDDHTLIASDNEGKILSLNNNNEDQDNLYDYHRSKELVRLQNENIRLLYVAITRAKEDCHLIGSVTENSKGEIAPPKNSLLNILWPQEITIENEKFVPIEEFVPKLRRLKSENFNRNIIVNTPIPPIKNIKKKKISNDSVYSFTGTLIHKYYELIIYKQLDIVELLSNKLSFIKNIFVKNNFSDDEINSAIKVVEYSLLSLKNSKDGRWIYQLHKDESMEATYLRVIKDEVKTLIPDRIFIEDGVRWIIDYKTVFNDKLDLKIEAKTHIDQLNIYASLFDDGYLTQKAIYFVAQGRLIKI